MKYLRPKQDLGHCLWQHRAAHAMQATAKGILLPPLHASDKQIVQAIIIYKWAGRNYNTGLSLVTNQNRFRQVLHTLISPHRQIQVLACWKLFLMQLYLPFQMKTILMEMVSQDALTGLLFLRMHPLLEMPLRRMENI